ncbi:MAG: hypothetical protein ACRCX5_06580 [Bacteroidales bacterium]
MARYRYYQLIDTDLRNIVSDNDNPAGVNDNENPQTAAKMCRKWMKDNGIMEAILVTNDADTESMINFRTLTIGA